MFERLWQDLRHAARGLRRQPGYWVTATATLALVLGANSALFATLSATFLRPADFRDGGRVVRLYGLPPDETDPDVSHDLHEAELVYLREHARTLAELVSYSIRERALTGGAEATVVRDGGVTADLFALMAGSPVLGRGFTAEEEARGARVVVLGHALWQSALGGDPAVVGKTVELDGEGWEVVGVLRRGAPPHFMRADLWTPLGLRTAIPDSTSGRANLTTLGRLAPGVTLAQADAEVAALMQDVVRARPLALAGWRAGVMSIGNWQYDDIRTPLLVLLAAMGLLLLIACANITSLVLTRVAARGRELALREALGARRSAIGRLVLLEVALLHVAGAAAGLLLAFVLLPMLLRIDPAATRVLGPVAIDWRVALFAFGSALVMASVAAVIPAWHAAAGGHVAHAAGGRVRSGGGRAGWRRLILVVQTALCVALLVWAGLLVRSLRAAAAIEPGFRAEGVLTAQLRLSAQRHGTPEVRVQVVRDVLERARALPGVVAAGTGLNDFVPGNTWVAMIHIEDRPTRDGTPRSVMVRRVSGEYFAALGIPLLQGRVFDDRDRQDAPEAAIVSRMFARRHWPGEDPIGKQIRQRAGRLWTVVGVVGDVADVDLVEAPEPTLYFPWSQANTTNSPVAIVIRTTGDPAALAAPLRATLHALDRLLPVDRIRPLETFLDESLAPARFRAALLAVLGLVGLVLGAVGIAGLTAEATGERLGEFGVRLALGGEPIGLWRLVLIRPLGQVVTGALLGVALGAAGGRALAALLPDTQAFDAGVTACAVVVLLLTTTAAAAVPAARVLRLDPARVLREAR